MCENCQIPSTKDTPAGSRRALFASRFKCMDCSEPNYDDYMAETHIWKEAVPEPRGKGKFDFQLLHLSCLERRLGRGLVLTDFKKNLPINRLLFIGYRLGWSDRKKAEQRKAFKGEGNEH